jgi:fermentation-respiration switch protein FrsA (DUF1100 family)
LGLAYKEANFTAGDGTGLAGWYLPAADPWLALLYSHGNGGDIRDWVHAAPPFLDEGISLLIWDYRGFGRSEGKPSEAGLYQDGAAAWEWLSKRAAAESWLSAFRLHFSPAHPITHSPHHPFGLTPLDRATHQPS